MIPTRIAFCKLSLLGLAVLVGCTSEPVPAVDGTCEPASVDCSVDGIAGDGLGLAGYACTGQARPDSHPKYLDGVPQGMVCAERGPAESDGKTSYCCTVDTVPCAYNPVASCESQDTVGFQCRGSSRPEMLNPTISCTQGIREGDFIDYCCSGTQRIHACADFGGCASGRTGWTCKSGVLPSSQDLGPNQSRSNLYRMLCPVPVQAANPIYYNFCCFVPAPRPPGASCVQDIEVPGCQPGRFGIACYGPDRPDQDFRSLTCPEPGVPGVSAEGYAATLYCCDFKEQ
jgi:hypothetical protein